MRNNFCVENYLYQTKFVYFLMILLILFAYDLTLLHQEHMFAPQWPDSATTTIIRIITFLMMTISYSPPSHLQQMTHNNYHVIHQSYYSPVTNDTEAPMKITKSHISCDSVVDQYMVLIYWLANMRFLVIRGGVILREIKSAAKCRNVIGMEAICCVVPADSDWNIQMLMPIYNMLNSGVHNLRSCWFICKTFNIRTFW
jgi:hypothetical protein